MVSWKFKDMFAHQREETQNGGCSPKSILDYLGIWLRYPSRTHHRFTWRFLANYLLKNIYIYINILKYEIRYRKSILIL
jgi:hypothetical protein